MPAETATFDAAHAALDRCDAAIATLDAECCEPGRSPRMRRLAETVTEARRLIADIGDDGDRAAGAIAALEDAGAQVGFLQVGCCAPSRIPLYAEVLEGLMAAQRRITGALRLDHGGTAAD